MQDDQDTAAPVRSTDLARRKAILKGLGKTAAVAGAATPLTTLAGARLRYVDNGQSMHCSVSGAMSVLMSGAVSSIAQCSALAPAAYGYARVITTGTSPDPTGAEWVSDATRRVVAKGNWPAWPDDGTKAKTISKDGNTRTPKATFAQVFGAGSSTVLGQLMIDSPTSDEGHWLTALLNAQKKYPASWPHPADKVIEHYSASNKVAALAFYKKINHV